MVIYTVVPAEAILGRADERHFAELSIGNTVVIVEPVDSGKGRIIRVCSTDPQHYLLPGLQPGDVVPLNTSVSDKGSANEYHFPEASRPLAPVPEVGTGHSDCSMPLLMRTI